MAVLKFGDRVRETTSTEGLIDYLLDGTSESLERTFVDGIGYDNGCYYCCEDLSDYEIGYGIIVDNAGNPNLQRVEVYLSSNSNNKVNWGIGVKTIFNTAIAKSLDHIAGFGVNDTDVSWNRELVVATEGQDTFPFQYVTGATEIRVDGVVLNATEYDAITGTEIVLNTPCTVGQKVDMMGLGQMTVKIVEGDDSIVNVIAPQGSLITQDEVIAYIIALS